MAALTGNSVGSSYLGLLKTTDNAALDATLKTLTDGAGNNAPIQMSTSTVNFTGSVTGIDGIVPAGGTADQILVKIDGTDYNYQWEDAAGGGGVADGTGSNAMVTTLTDLPASATGVASLAFGRNASSTNDSSVAIGNYASATGSKGISIGSECTASGSNSIVMGWNMSASGFRAVAIGQGANGADASGVSLGASSGYLTGAGTEGVSIGYQNGFSNGNQATSIGHNATAKNTNGIVLGHSARLDASGITNSIAIGYLAGSPNSVATFTNGTAIGYNAKIAAATTEAIAIGSNITASKDETLSTKNIEIQGNGNSLTMYSPDGTEYAITVTNAGALLVTSV